MQQPPRYPDRPLIRRDADGRERTAPDWESLTERLIREAQAAGHFDDLPLQGQPLPRDPLQHAGEMATAFRLLHNAGMAPPWVETDKHARAVLERIEDLIRRARRGSPAAGPRLRGELEALADEHDAAARRLESMAPTPRQHRPLADRTTLRARLEAALGDTGPQR